MKIAKCLCCHWTQAVNRAGIKRAITQSFLVGNWLIIFQALTVLVMLLACERGLHFRSAALENSFQHVVVLKNNMCRFISQKAG